MSTHYSQQFAKQETLKSPWLAQWTRKNFEVFQDFGFPTTKLEGWKYTSLKALTELPFERTQAAVQIQCTHPQVEIRRLSEVMSKNPELLEKYLNTAPHQAEGALLALNGAFLRDGFWIRIPRGVVVTEPIEILHQAAAKDFPSLFTLRNIIVAEADSQAVLLEKFSGVAGEQRYWTHSVCQIHLEENAVLRHYKIQEESTEDFHLASLIAEQAASSRLESYQLSLGAALGRQETTGLLLGEGAECRLNGLYLGQGRQHLDHQTLIDHRTPHCQSHELFKGILDDRSQGVFNGQIVVRPHAQKTNSSLTNKNLLLSPEALVNTKPLLEIFANDVKCSHGATIGRLDENQVFYLRSRGIQEKLARNLLTYAFAREVFEDLTLPELKHDWELQIQRRLHLQGLEDR